MSCQSIELHDDMYPEFAPDPIEIRCEEDATMAIAVKDLAGYKPEEEYLEVYCEEHGKRLLAESSPWTEYRLVADLSKENKK